METNVDYKTEINEGSPREYYTWQEIEQLVESLAGKIKRSYKKYDGILAITNGGIIPARLISRELNINDIRFISIRNKKLLIKDICSSIKDKKYLIVDDIYDTGNTFIKVFDAMRGFDCNFAFLMSGYRDSNAKVVAKVLNHDKWVVFPWEKYK